MTADVLIIDADKDMRGELRTNGNTRKLAKGAYCAKPGRLQVPDPDQPAAPQVGSTAAVGFGDPFK